MVKQKIMYLLCLLMFAVGINAQFTPGTVDYGSSSNVASRSAKGVTQSATYDATTGEVVYTFEVTGHDLIRTGRDGQGVTITDTNLNVTSVTVKVGSTTMNAVKSANSGQPDRSGERAQVWIAKPASGKIVGSSTITVRVKPASAGEAVRISGLYTWQADDNILSTAAGHFNEASAPITNTYNYLGIGGPNGITYQTPVPDSVKPSITASDIIVYRGEQVSNKTMTVSDDKGLKTITVSNSPAVEGTFTIPTINGQTSATVTLKLSDAGGLVPLNKGRVTQGLINDINRERETSHTITATDNANNIQTATFKVIVRTQTQAYTASEKAGITKTFDLDATAPEASSLVSVTKIASSLDNTPRNATYTYVTAPKMNQVGTQTVKVRVKYEDDSYDDVDVQIVIKEKAPVATGSEFTVYRGEDYSLVNNGQPFVTATHSSQNITAFAPKGANPPSTVVTAGVANVSIRSDVPKNPGYLRGRAGVIVPLNSALGTATYVYTARIGEVSLGNTIHSNEANVIIHTKAQTEAYTASEKAGIRKRFNLNSTAPTPESLVSVVKDVSTLPSIPRNATYTYVTAPKMDQAGVQTVTVRVKYEDESYDDVDIVFEIINRNPIINQLPIPIRVWKDQPVQNPIKVPANDPDGTIVSVRLASENGLTATYDNGIITIAGTPIVVSNGMTYIFATDNNGGRGSRLIDFVIMDAKGGKITKNWDETVSQQEVLDKVTIIDTSTAHRNVTRTILDPIPSYQDIKNGASPIVRVELVTETGEKKIVEVEIEYIISFCTKPANTTGAALNTIVGITDLGRAESNGNLNDDTSWPIMRKGGWLALESNNKGFVVTRMTTTQITAISTPQEGMMVYDTTAKCLKLYDGTKWSCFTKPVCPKF